MKSLKGLKTLNLLLTAAAALCLLAACGKSLSVPGARGARHSVDGDTLAAAEAVSPYGTLLALRLERRQKILAKADTVTPPITAPVMDLSGSSSRLAGAPPKDSGGKRAPHIYLQSLDIQVEVTGNIASTRYTMVFRNRTDKVLEGKLTFPLPDGLAVTHYALDIDGKMRDAVPVDKELAARVFEQIQRREVDPGLLEKVQGNNFRTRVYPIPAGGTRTVAIGYEEELPLSDGALHYRLPMDYPDPLENFSFKAAVWKGGPKPLAPDSEEGLRFEPADGNYTAAFARKNYRPGRALNFALPAPADTPRVMMRHANGSSYFLASVAPDMAARKKEWSGDLAVIWDVSLSGLRHNLRREIRDASTGGLQRDLSRDLEREIEMLDIIFAEKKNANVHLYFLNNKLNKSVNKNTAGGAYKVTGGNWDELKGVLENAVFDGGTDFSQIDLNNIAGDEILFFSDGISTLSDANFIKNTVRYLRRPIHCIVSSAKADYGAMKLIAGKTGGKFININAMSAEELKDELLTEMPWLWGIWETTEDPPKKDPPRLRNVHSLVTTPVSGIFSVAGISTVDNTELILQFGYRNELVKTVKIQLDAKKAASQGNIDKIWAQMKIAELDLQYEKNLAEITALGTRFGIVTRGTSLLVLEHIDDYVQFEIEPPATEPALLAEYKRRVKEREESAARHRDNTTRSLLDGAAAAAGSLKAWWNTDFPLPNDDDDEILGGIMGGGGGGLALIKRGGIEENDVELVPAQPIITIKPIKEDAEYFKVLTGKLADDYQLYLKLRDEYGNSPKFYFDMANWFYKRKDRETALRVLTSIAELDIENASLYRLLGYRFKEYGEYGLQKFVCKKVTEWRPFEPQSYRDYAHALADNGEAQAALDSLYSTLTRAYPNDIAERGAGGLDEVVVTEINRLIAKNPHLDISKIDKRLLISIPVDIRVVINWNMDNADIDFHVKDPNGEECFFGNSLTRIGGRMSRDNTSGYGPEQFLLRKAVKGKYLVSVNYYGRREFTDDGPATVMAEFFTKYAGADEQRRMVCLQLLEAARGEDGKIEVVEFEF